MDIAKKNNLWAEALIIGLVFLVPIAICRGAYDWVLVKLLLAQVLAAGILSCLLFIDFKKIEFNLLDVFIMAYGAVCLFSLVISEYKYASFTEFSKIAAYLLLYAGVRHFAASVNLKNVAAALVISTDIACCYGIVRFAENKLMLATFGNQNWTAGYLVWVLPVTISLSWYSFFKGRLTEKIFFSASSVLMFWTLVLCRSRAAWFAIGAGMVAFLVFYMAADRKKLLLAILIIFAIIFLVYLTWGDLFLTMFFNDIRPWLWKSSWVMLKEMPALGYGLGTYPVYNLKFRSEEYLSHVQAADITEHAHCEFLEVACETGLAGLAVFLAIILTFFIFAFRKISRMEGYPKALCLGLVSGVAALLAHNLTDVNMRFASSGVFFWFSLGLVPGLCGGKVISGVPGLKPVICKICIITGLTLLILITVKTVTVDFLSNVYLKAGVDKRNKGDWAGAAGYYKKALEANPYLIPAYGRLGYACGIMGNYECAAWANQEILKISPYYGPAYKDLGAIYFSRGRLDDALSNFQKAFALLPYDSGILNSIKSIKDNVKYNADF